MNNIFRKFEIFVIVVIIAVIGIIYALTQKPATLGEVKEQAQPQQQEISASSVSYQGVEGQNAFELLKASHQVEFTHYDFGDFVTSINGVAADEDHFWSFYINGAQSQVGASAYVTKSSDLIEWKLEEIEE